MRRFVWIRDAVLKRLGAALPFVALACAPLALAQDSLRFDNNWFVTGDYVTAGVALRGQGGADGYAAGSIHVPTLPNGADPIAAFLYWSSVENTQAPGAANGYFNGFPIQGDILGSAQANPGCGSSGGTAGPGTYGRAYRADVLRYFPLGAGDIRQASRAVATVKLPDSGGKGNGQLPYTDGATLLLIYRVVVPGSPSVAPLRAVVAYDGAFTMPKNSPGFHLNVAGFYQASGDPDAKVTFLAANGQQNTSAPLFVNNFPLSWNPFNGAVGARWDNPTFRFALAPNASSFETLITPGSEQTCLTFAAAIASVNVADSDSDGLLDVWETSGLHRNTQASPATFGTCQDYPSEPCVNLPAMGAKNGTRDIFIQVDWMHGYGDHTGGLDGSGYHDHKPNLDSLESVCATFAGRGIAMHFDVGNNYQGNPCIVPYKDWRGNVLAQGGSDIDEATLLCQDTPTHQCVYHEPYPVLSFGFGFDSVRDGNQGAGITAHFAQSRKDSFHYALFAHALAGPFNSSGQPIDPYTSAQLSLPPTPYSYSGIATRPGGGFMVTLGLWRSDVPANDQVGSSLVQAGTLMHELGHNLGLGHAGLATQPNCMPNYPSVMNYSYQTRGLTDASGAEHIDFSQGRLASINENALSPVSLGTSPYRLRYFGPLATGTPPGAAAKVHCDGTPILNGALAVRLEGAGLGTPNWSNGTNPQKLPFQFDTNFDGVTGQTFSDQPDWSSLNLQQVGSGASFGSLSVGAFATDGGALATDGGALATDAGALATDGGAFATDGGAFATDGGAFATDGGAFATDGGALATDGGALATDAGEQNYDTQIASGPDAPTGLTAVNQLGGILVQWTPPDSGAVTNYDIYRCAGTGCVPALFHAGWIPPSKSAPSFTDTVNDTLDAGATCPAASTCYNTAYTYQTLANVSAVVNGATTFVSSTLSNSASSEVTHLFVIAGNVAAVYGTKIAPPPFTIYGDVAGSLSSASVTCAYPAGTRNAGTYAITCSGPAASSAADGVTYNTPYLSYTPGNLTITPAPLTIAAVANTKVYDGTTSAAATPAVSGLQTGDTVTSLAETYDTRNVGTSKTLTVTAYTINDGNGGNNYTLTKTMSTLGTIT
ncbi:MAG TPA: YDG domain-containing protein, partial [Bryobacteraceae bacterium]|nr:YDG domain-containing protein [Bryobacteraceae bacterium]